MAEAIFHITTIYEGASRSRGQYVPASYPGEGFIHFSISSQLLSTSNRLFKDRYFLLCLELNRKVSRQISSLNTLKEARNFSPIYTGLCYLEMLMFGISLRILMEREFFSGEPEKGNKC